MSTIKTVLNCARDIEYYSIIINKLSPKAYDILVDKNFEELKILVAEITGVIENVTHTPAILPLKNQLKLVNVENEIINWKELDKFVKEAPCTTVTPDSVHDIPKDFFESYKLLVIQYINELREDKERYARLIEETHKKYHNLVQENIGNAKVISFILSFYLSD